jgi:hypothetical protein
MAICDCTASNLDCNCGRNLRPKLELCNNLRFDRRSIRKIIYELHAQTLIQGPNASAHPPCLWYLISEIPHLRKHRFGLFSWINPCRTQVRRLRTVRADPPWIHTFGGPKKGSPDVTPTRRRHGLFISRLRGFAGPRVFSARCVLSIIHIVLILVSQRVYGWISKVEEPLTTCGSFWAIWAITSLDNRITMTTGSTMADNRRKGDEVALQISRGESSMNRECRLI